MTGTGVPIDPERFDAELAKLHLPAELRARVIDALAVRCAVAGCERPAEPYVLVIGGEPVRAGFCGPHGAEYRVDEASP